MSAARIARLIAAQGPLSIAQYMTLALHDPKSGAYGSRDPLGRDFITAPEVSQMFGELVGLWVVQCWRDQGAPSPARLVELGPGRGTLMADALRAARVVPEFLANIEVVMVEASPALQAIQQERLKDAGVAIRWTARFEAGERPFFLIANEFFDALPIRQYVKTPRGWCERMVTADESGDLAFALAPVPSAIAIPASRGEPEDGAVYEISPAAIALTQEIADAIGRHGGAALIVDYGHAGSGFGETLQAVKQHKFASLLDADADLSAHVDFAALADAARGAKVFGPIGQGALLNALGLQERAAQLIAKNPGQTQAIDAAIDRLTMQMGNLFKALAIMPPDAPPPPGF